MIITIGREFGSGGVHLSGLRIVYFIEVIYDVFKVIHVLILTNSGGFCNNLRLFYRKTRKFLTARRILKASAQKTRTLSL